MKTIPLLALGAAMGAALAAPAWADSMPKPLAHGQAVPLRDTKMKNVDDRELSIADAAGKKGTLVIFICNHCPWVKAWQSRIAEVGNAAAEKGVGVIAINPNDPSAYPEDGFDEMKDRAKQVDYRFPYVMDETSDVARAFGATHTPEAFLFDAKGKLVYHGAVDDNARDPSSVKSTWLKDAVESLAAGKKIVVAESKAMGCSVKYREKSAG